MLEMDGVAEQSRNVVGIAQRVDVGKGEGSEVWHGWDRHDGTWETVRWKSYAQRCESGFLAETLPDDRKHLGVQVPAASISTLNSVPCGCRRGA